MTSTDATWTATPQDVERLIAAVLPHTSSDDYTPACTSVRLEIDGDRFVAVATDRYTMAAAWSKLTAWEEDAPTHQTAEACIYAADFRRLFAFLRPQKKDAAVWSLTDKSLTVATGEQSLTIKTVEVSFPNWRKVLGELTDKVSASTGTPVMRFTPSKIENFLKSAKALGQDFGSIIWNFGGAHTDAPVIRIGENFVGLLMPQRYDEMPALDLTPLGIGEAATPEVAA